MLLGLIQKFNFPNLALSTGVQMNLWKGVLYMKLANCDHAQCQQKLDVQNTDIKICAKIIHDAVN